MKALAHKILLTLLFSATAQAQVNLQDGSFNYSAKDFGFLDRHYSSRSIHLGVFGLSWCSPLDLRSNLNCGLNLKNLKPKFTAQGQIQSWVLGRKQVQVIYKDKQAHEILYDGLRFRLEWNLDQNRITKISRTELHFIHYNYSGIRLVSHRGASTAQFKYDENLNLNQLITPNTVLVINYEDELDFVKEIKPLGGCQEHYKFSSQPSGGSQKTTTDGRSKTKASDLQTQTSEVYRTCPGQAPALVGRYDFTYQQLKNGKLKLSAVQSWQLDQEKLKMNPRISRGTE